VGTFPLPHSLGVHKAWSLASFDAKLNSAERGDSGGTLRERKTATRKSPVLGGMLHCAFDERDVLRGSFAF
jgi:hypothetical protein